MKSKEPTHEKMIEAVKSYYGLKIDDNAYDSADVYAYEETTADGYSVYVVTHDMRSICVNEDVYYYESDVPSAIMECITNSNGYCTLYADQYFLDDIYFDDMLLEEFSEIAEKIYDEIANDEGDYGFDMAEILWLKEEFTESEEINQTVSQLIVVQFPRTTNRNRVIHLILVAHTHKVWAFRGMSKQQQTITKQLQNLYSWTQFYQERGNKEQIRKCQTEIAQLKQAYNKLKSNKNGKTKNAK